MFGYANAHMQIISPVSSGQPSKIRMTDDGNAVAAAAGFMSKYLPTVILDLESCHATAFTATFRHVRDDDQNYSVREIAAIVGRC